MTLFKIITLIAGSIIVLYLLWQLVVLPFIGWVIDRFKKKPKDLTFFIQRGDSDEWEHVGTMVHDEPSKN